MAGPISRTQPWVTAFRRWRRRLVHGHAAEEAQAVVESPPGQRLEPHADELLAVGPDGDGARSRRPRARRPAASA